MAALVFDLDGTLVDSAPDLLGAANKFLADFGAEPLGLATLHSFVGNGVPKLVERLVSARGLDQTSTDQADLVRQFLAHYDAALFDLSEPYPGVRDCLEILQQAGHKLAVCTNKPEQQAKAIVDGLGLGGFFDEVVGGDRLDVKKPDPAPLLHAFECLGAAFGLSSGAKDTHFYVGDSEVDLATAKAADIPFFLFTEGYRKTALDEMTGDRARFSHFDDLAALLP
ncbi:MAG: phosphoglycolate phosphatase [Cohaesibacter sp.]|jgi:phosphoglycolate phosphatase|nr:phosphoglycolate phosphatase [Cohaesibacter sp.]